MDNFICGSRQFADHDIKLPEVGHAGKPPRRAARRRSAAMLSFAGDLSPALRERLIQQEIVANGPVYATLRVGS